MLKLPVQALEGFASSGTIGALLNGQGSLASLVDAQWQPLLTPLSTLAAQARNLDVPLFDTAQGTAATALGWDWALNAGASASVLIDALDPAEHTASGIPELPGQVVLRCTVKGRLEAGLNGKQKTGAWTFGLGASMEAEAAIDWLVAGAPMESLALALSGAARDGAFVAPMDLQEQLHRAGTGRFMGTLVTLKGGFSASAKVAAAASGTGWSWGLNGDRAQVGFTLGVEGESSLKLSGLFTLSVMPEQRGGIMGVRVTLDRLDRSERSLAASLSAGADFSALARSADTFLRARLPDPAKVAAQLDVLTNPASALKAAAAKRLSGLFADEPDLANLAKLVLGVDPTAKAALADRLGEALTGHVTDWLDRVAIDGNSGLEDAQSAAVAWIRARLGGQALSDQAMKAIEKAVTGLVNDTKAGLDTAIADLEKKLTGKPLDAVQEVLDELGALGERIFAEVTAPLAAAGATLAQSDAVKAIRAGLASYSALRQKVLKALGDAQRAKLLITFGATLQEKHSVRSLFSGWFTHADDMTAANALFRGLWRGHLDDLVGLIDAAERSQALHEPSGWLLRSFQSTRTSSVSVSLLGYTFTDTRIRTVDLDVRSDVNGNLVAVNGSAGAKAEIRNRWISRQTELSVTVQFLDPGKISAQAVLELQGAFTAAGRDVDAAYLRSLEASLRLMTQGRGTRDLRHLLETPETQLLNDARFWNAVTFLLPLSLAGDEWRIFAEQPESVIRRSAAAWGLKCLDVSQANDSAFAFDRPSEILLDFGKQVTPADPLAGVAAYLASLPDTNRAADLGATELKRIGFEELRMSESMSSLRRRLETFLRFGRVCRGIVRLAENHRRLQQIAVQATPTDEEGVFEQTRKVLKAITTALAPASVAGMTFTAKGEGDVPWPLVTFAATLADLSGRDVPPGFVPMGIVSGREERPVPLIEL